VTVIPLAGVVGSIDWRLPFLLHLIAVPPFVLIALLVRRTASRASDQPEPAGIGTRTTVRLVLMGLACGLLCTTAPVYLPFHLAAIGEVEPQRVALAMTTTGVMGALCSFFYERVRRYLSAADVFVVAFALGAIGTGFAAVSNTIWTAAAGLTLLGVGIGLVGANLFAVAAAAVPPERRSRAIGLARGAYLGAPLAAQLPLEPLIAVHGPTAPLAALALFFVAALAIFFAARRDPAFAA
jgi:predicted MFS family arabinose efflux permease